MSINNLDTLNDNLYISDGSNNSFEAKGIKQILNNLYHINTLLINT